jgi:hypothetical protein
MRVGRDSIDPSPSHAAPLQLKKKAVPASRHAASIASTHIHRRGKAIGAGSIGIDHDARLRLATLRVEFDNFR